MGTPEFPDLGKHCSADGCKLIDFLPFDCDKCRKVFCVEHRSYTTHQCPNATQQDVMVLICPLCAKGVRLVPNQDPNITWDIHVNAECDPSNYRKATKKKRCPVPGCKDFLSFSNSIRCRDCTQEHCLKHRFGPDHECPGPKKPGSGFPFIAMLRKSQKGTSAAPAQTSPDGGPSWWSSSSLLNAASSVRASAETGMQRLSVATNQALQKARDGMAQSSGSNGNGSGSFMKQCLPTGTALIDHVEKSHERGGRQTNSLVDRATVDVCPNCSRAFRDPVLLVEHVERDHTGSSKAYI
ncbi:zinc finger AN1 and C2H2 domain-containing stress-associated protein 16-like [Iris pallida]|uniref:Zinc finger AN1 and C2H2 domain-containing stress-associated protein 16-like n=1 Tax=Iris pallida TaxID=29817 RepID=A0AAX6I1G4_IRIPA|nr:zinc finger AN1 and C2H2 domain-containing stress-associated protein 16-like [Iris pallida]